MSARKILTSQGSVVIAKGAITVLLGSVLARLLHLLVRGILGHNLGATGYGVVMLGLTITGLAAMLATLGLSTGVGRFIARHRAESNHEEARAAAVVPFLIVLIVSSGLALMLWIFADPIAASTFGEPSLTVPLRILSLTIPPTALLSVVGGVLRGKKQVVRLSLVKEGIIPVSRLIFVGVAVMVAATAVSIAWGYVAFRTIALLGGLYVLGWRSLRLRGWLRHRRTATEMLRFSWPLIPSEQLDEARKRGDTLLLGALGTVTDVGMYSAALPLALVTPLPFVALNRFIMPVLTETQVTDAADLPRAYKEAARWAVLGSGPLVIVVLVLGRPLLGAVFGPAFFDAYPALQILVGGMFLNAASGPFGETFIALGKPEWNLRLAVASVAVLFAVGVALIPQWGFIGAAWASTSALAAITLIGVGGCYLQFGLQPVSFAYMRSLATLGIIGSAFMIWGWAPESIIGMVLTGAGLLCAILLGFVLTRSITRSDTEVLLAVASRVRRRLAR